MGPVQSLARSFSEIPVWGQAWALGRCWSTAGEQGQGLSFPAGGEHPPFSLCGLG